MMNAQSGLKSFKLNATDDFLPRVGYLAVGDKFTENCICYDDAEFSNDAAFVSALGAIASTTLYGGLRCYWRDCCKLCCTNSWPKTESNQKNNYA